MMKEDNPLYKFKYCPICGSAHFDELNDNARQCADCDFTYYTNPKGATVALIVNDKDEILVARRAKAPGQGMLDMVGGFIDLGESGEKAMCREIHEETGLTPSATDIRYIFSLPNRYPFSGIIVHTVDMFFEYRVEGRPEVKAMDDVADLQWMPIDSLCINEFAFESIQKGLMFYIMSK